MNNFQLAPGLAEKDFVIDLPLSRILINDSKDFPWIFLVPRRNNIVQIDQLSVDDNCQLMQEIVLASRAMQKLFPCDRINVAVIGNMTAQLHVHIICRRKDDVYWPDVCWNKPMQKLPATEIKQMASKICEQLLAEIVANPKGTT